MRAKIVLYLLPIMVFLAAPVVAERSTATRLRKRYLELSQRQGELHRLQVKHGQLRDQLTEAERRGAAGDQVDPSLQSLAPGKWLPSAAWRNEGQATPRATLATVLWAAAAGDLPALQATLEFDDSAHAKAREFFALLSPGTRSQYATGEDVVASVLLTRIPLTEAQLMWLHQTDADHAVAALRLANPHPQSGPASADAATRESSQLSSRNRGRTEELPLHRTSTGWRVVVPASLVEHMAGALGAPLAKQ
jgi:hypothetical protein